MLPLFCKIPRLRILLIYNNTISNPLYARARIYIMCSLLLLFSLPLKNMFYNILINQRVTKLFQKTCEKMIDIFGTNRYIRYFCTRFPRDGKPWNWLADRNGAKNIFSSPFISLSQRETTRKRKKKKTSENIWKIYLKVITFASAFWKEKQFKKEAIFEEFT